MTRKDALKLGAATGVAVGGAGLLPRVANAASVGAGSRLSVLLIVVDDMPDRLLSVMGADRSRLINKSWPYQESIEIPLIMRATGCPSREPTRLASSVDISSTILKFAGAAPPRAPDGRSLHHIVLGEKPGPWRKRVVIEDPDEKHWQMYREFQPAAGKDFAYIRHLDEPTPEFYDLTMTGISSIPGRTGSRRTYARS